MPKRTTPECDRDASSEPDTKEPKLITADTPDLNSKADGWDVFPNDTLAENDFRRLISVMFGYNCTIHQAQRKADGHIVAIKCQYKWNCEGTSHFPTVKATLGIVEQLQHPRLVAFLGHYQVSNSLNLVFAYDQDTPTLGDLLTQRNLSEDETAHYTLQIAAALDHIHSKGAVLRNLDDFRVLCSEDYTIKLYDFDSMCLLNAEGTAHGEHGMDSIDRAPEMIEGGRYGTSVDWWSLGILVYYMITYLKPFHERFAHAGLHPSCKGNPVLNANVRLPKFLTDDMCELITELLNKSPGDRLSSLAELKSLPIYNNMWPSRTPNDMFWR
ncbi:uncharacterized protein MELLADRAFT_94327 [Melampsora larici-populina 98AG31]|uniref:Protein kinase domain-containing protein n=1 Tax=Melampsora larici-populina (strain 98AG31 / pathotype 3-4-7) TaxID=747676 RepID=F4S7B2_MELLP|nr:uncharacterized protein MELLADRAFT_94327 [Melampsora larici-populina 98AG31]EGF99487.1 hypothetical protein MELLADRAFT_94327 [Melampsora larici-populina 98AG31]